MLYFVVCITFYFCEVNVSSTVSCSFCLRNCQINFRNSNSLPSCQQTREHLDSPQSRCHWMLHWVFCLFALSACSDFAIVFIHPCSTGIFHYAPFLWQRLIPNIFFISLFIIFVPSGLSSHLLYVIFYTCPNGMRIYLWTFERSQNAEILWLLSSHRFSFDSLFFGIKSRMHTYSSFCLQWFLVVSCTFQVTIYFHLLFIWYEAWVKVCSLLFIVRKKLVLLQLNCSYSFVDRQVIFV